MDDLHSSREEDGTLETMDPQDLLGLGVSVSRAIGFRRGILAVVVILVKGHAFPIIVKVRPAGLQVKLTTITLITINVEFALSLEFYTFSDPLGYDLLALVDGFTPVEDNIGLLETRFDEEVVFVFVFPEDVTGLVNLTLLSLFFGFTTTNLSLEMLMLGQICPIIISNS
ncbi:hypothetical protein Tco_0978541 [Tanacetum coccineum]|uniref:Uncharacterized protein n=1 Tax=Tanacetum coccineum TaxID=301880 RepID=A0ABQ5EN61_9ASTR